MIRKIIIETLDELKGKDILEIDVRKQTSITDYMIICTGTSTRQVKSLAQYLIEKIKAASHSLFGVEGEDTAQWILIDAGDVIVHVMLEETRDFYQLEKLWMDEDINDEN